MNSKTKVTKQDIERALTAYDDGRRLPSGQGSGPAKWWFLLKDGELYPAKHIYTLAAHMAGKDTPLHPKQMDALEQFGYEMVNLNNIKIHSNESIHEDFQKKIKGSSPSARKARLKNAPKKPTKTLKLFSVINRDPDVVVEVLLRAKGICENKKCKKDGPFKRKHKHPALNGQWFLEVHHKEQLAKGGDDTVENAVALCPNCHRQVHHYPSITKYL